MTATDQGSSERRASDFDLMDLVKARASLEKKDGKNIQDGNQDVIEEHNKGGSGGKEDETSPKSNQKIQADEDELDLLKIVAARAIAPTNTGKQPSKSDSAVTTAMDRKMDSDFAGERMPLEEKKIGTMPTKLEGYFEDPSESNHQDEDFPPRLHPSSSSRQPTSASLVPGAYSGGPGGNVERRDRVSFSHLTTTTASSSDAFHNSQMVPEEDAGLVVANPVMASGDDEEMQQARPSTSSAKPNGDFESRRNWFCMGCALLVFLCFGLVLIPILRDNSEGSSSATNTAVAEPTNPPLPSSRKEIESYVLELLPAGSRLAAMDASAPQSQALQWLLADPQMDGGLGYEDWRILQRMALATLYYSTNTTKGWFNDTDWLSYKVPECLWHNDLNYKWLGEGGTKNKAYLVREFSPNEANCHTAGNASMTTSFTEGSYKHLWLPYNGLAGTMPEELYLLSNLQSVDLTGNDLVGTISSRVANFRNLKLFDLTKNKVTGTLPTEMGLMKELSLLFWHGNRLTGTIPTEIASMTYLASLRIDINLLTGTIPTQMGLLSTHLNHLLIADNAITGTIHTELMMMAVLQDLVLAFNPISGSIPSQIGLMSSLKGTSINGAAPLTGTIPTQVGLLSQLKRLSLSINDLSGTIPSQLGLLSSTFFFLAIRDNPRISGTIPCELGALTLMKTLVVSNMSLTGTVPSELESWSSAKELVLHTNQLTGSIPEGFWNFTLLQDFRVYNNRLTGTIPSSMSVLSVLDTWSMANNSLHGTLPSQIGLLSGLESLDLSSNAFSGTFPAAMENWTAPLKEFNISSNQFTGTLPLYLGTMAENWPSLEVFDVSDNGFIGELPAGLCVQEKENAVLSFDCTASLCGCSSCSCLEGATNAISVNAGNHSDNATIPSQVFANETSYRMLIQWFA